MGRSIKAVHAYSLRGAQHAAGMLEHLNTNLSNKGIYIKRVIITNVVLSSEVAQSMQERTIYQFKNTLERKTFAYKQRIKNDQEEEIKEKQIKEQQRKDVEENAKLDQLAKRQEIEKIKAETEKIKQEWKAKTTAEIQKINAETDLEYNKITAEAELIKTQIIEKASADAAEIMANADAYYVTTIANAKQEVAPQIAEAVKLEGQAEKELQKGFAQKRLHDEIMQKIDAIESFANNKNSVIFGEQGGNLMAQVETYKMVQR